MTTTARAFLRMVCATCVLASFGCGADDGGGGPSSSAGASVGGQSSSAGGGSNAMGGHGATAGHTTLGGSGGAGGAGGSTSSGGSHPGGGHAGSSSAQGGGGASAGSSGGGGPSCTSVFDCPNWENPGPCDDISCDFGHCTDHYATSGTTVSSGDVFGDCQGLVCDATGGTVIGSVDTDVPEDGSVCAMAACDHGTPKHTPAALGTPCSSHGATCDGAGTCKGTGVTPCTSMFDCTGAAPTCQEWLCDGGTCIVVDSASGALAPDPPGNCLALVCDGHGAAVSTPADSDVPNDMNGCTVDACQAGTPVFTPRPVGHPCNDQSGDYCLASTSCVACPIPDLQCTDYGVGEPNGTIGQAYFIDTISDCDSAGLTACGVLSGAGDVDVLEFQGVDTTFCDTDPSATVSALTPVTLCLYLECLKDTLELTCPDGTTASTSPEGKIGCCQTGTNPTVYTPGAACANTSDDSLWVWMSVSSASALPCTPYTLAYHF